MKLKIMISTLVMMFHSLTCPTVQEDTQGNERPIQPYEVDVVYKIPNNGSKTFIACLKNGDWVKVVYDCPTECVRSIVRYEKESTEGIIKVLPTSVSNFEILKSVYKTRNRKK